MQTLLLATLLAMPPVDFAKIPPENRLPARNLHSDALMQPACTRVEAEKLRDKTVAILGAREGRRAWSVALTMLCGTSDQSHAFLRARMPERVSHEVFPDENQSTRTTLIAREEVAMVHGHAWDVTVDFDRGKLSYAYIAGGVCSGFFSLRQVDGEWLLVASGEACD
jgi:hypothetical protein